MYGAIKALDNVFTVKESLLAYGRIYQIENLRDRITEMVASIPGDTARALETLFVQLA